MALVSMNEFLTSVDVPAKDEEFIRKVVNILAGEGLELTEVLDLDGLSVDVITKSLPGSTFVKASSFICRAIRKATNKGASMAIMPVTLGGLFPPARATPESLGAFSGTAATQEQNYDMADFFARKKLASKKVHVMFAPPLCKINVNNLSEGAWPQGFAMNAAATEASRRSSLLVDAGSTVLDEPFVCVDLRNFEPLWCKTNEMQDDEADDESKVKAKSKQRQQAPRWNVAFDKWALFAAARGQLSFAKCLEHKEICQKIAFRAMLGSKPRKAVLGVIYDEMARTKWAARCMQDTAFRADDVAGSLDEEVLREAEVCFDFENKQQPKGDGKGQAAATTCYNCGKPGHMAYDCFSKGKSAGKGGKGKAIVCYKCGEEGHKSTECSKQGVKRKHP